MPSGRNRASGEMHMTVIVKRGSTLLAAAILTACVAQRDNPPAQAPQSQSAAASATLPGPVVEEEPKEKFEVDRTDARDEVVSGNALPSAPMAQRLSGVLVKKTAVCCVIQPDVNTEKYQHLGNNPVH